MTVAKKQSTLKPPSQQVIELVLNHAASAPLQNLNHAKAVDAALNEVAAFFRALYSPASARAADDDGV